DPECLSAEAALASLDLFARIAKLADAGRTLVSRRIDECGAHRATGHLSSAHLLAAAAGTSLGEARDAIKTSKRLRDQPDLQATFQAGEMSLEQTVVISEAVAADPTAEEALLATAANESFRVLRDE